MIAKEIVERAIAEVLTPEEMLLTITISTSNDIRVIVDSDQAITIDRCIAITKSIESFLNRDEEDFSLEVSSAGLGDAFVLPRQYRKHEGKPVRVVTLEGMRHDGTLGASDEEAFTLLVEEMIPSPDGRHKKRRYEMVERRFRYDEIKSTSYRFE